MRIFFLSFFFLSLEIFYSSMPLLQRCIADSVLRICDNCFFPCIPIMAMKVELDPVFPIRSIPVSFCALFIEKRNEIR